ncbi:MAG: dihydroorotate dehydrogenase-like protein [Candidatus Cloacimonadota bacterium]|nr:dihydroorotate dehydrogenase-like protein [Candidatus Cloacimonadota bacterium]
MINLQTNYMGLELKNPIIVGASGLTGNIDSIKELAKAGAGAIILKSLFEEEITMKMENDMDSNSSQVYHTEMYDYLKVYGKQYIVEEYLKLIEDAKNEVDIPVIASINCMSSEEWVDFAKEVEKAGADGIELNIFILPSNPKENDTINTYFEIAKKVSAIVSIPISLKISSYFDNVAKTLIELSHHDIKGLVLFNRFYSPDIDIDKEKIIAGNYYTTQNDMANSLRWTGIMKNMVDCDLCASTGIHDGNDIIKFILAGSSAIQMVSSIYENSSDVISKSLIEITSWMAKHKYSNISQFKGKLAKSSQDKNSVFERVQFLKYFGTHDKE